MEQGERLVQACATEQRTAKAGGYELPLLIDLTSALEIVANLQLALRHPGNNGVSGRTARRIVRAMIERVREDGFVAHADLMELGNDPEQEA